MTKPTKKTIREKLDLLLRVALKDLHEKIVAETTETSWDDEDGRLVYKNKNDSGAYDEYHAPQRADKSDEINKKAGFSTKDSVEHQFSENAIHPIGTKVKVNKPDHWAHGKTGVVANNRVGGQGHHTVDIAGEHPVTLRSKHLIKESVLQKKDVASLKKDYKSLSPVNKSKFHKDLYRHSNGKPMKETSVKPSRQKLVKAKISTQREIGHRISDIGPGGKEHNVQTHKWPKNEAMMNSLSKKQLAGIANIPSTTTTTKPGAKKPQGAVAVINRLKGESSKKEDYNDGQDFKKPELEDSELGLQGAIAGEDTTYPYGEDHYVGEDTDAFNNTVITPNADAQKAHAKALQKAQSIQKKNIASAKSKRATTKKLAQKKSNMMQNKED